ncbi:MAG TPA: hemolysin family protein [Holophagaceae bacterium]|nr:hemolysin family protein [Holophagaceae bacterium]
MHGSVFAMAVVLLALCGFFVLAEFAAVRVRTTALEALVDEDPRARLALEVHRDLGRHLTSIQVAITLVTILLGASAEPSFIDAFRHLFGVLPWPKVGFLLGGACGLLLITLLQVVLAELVPRGVAIGAATTWALRTARPLLLWSSAVRPFTGFLLWLSHGVVWLLGLQSGEEAADEHLPSEEELKRMLARSQEQGQLDLDKKELIENLFDFSRRTVKEVAVPRGRVVCLDLKRPWAENLAMLKGTPHTRLPLIEGDLDKVLGIVHLKELLWALHERDGDLDLRALAHPVFLVPETKPIQALLLEFQQRKQHLALVVDEHGGVDGLVTLEDVLEELVGEIQDEFDREIIQLRRTRGGSWLAQGAVTLEQLEDHLHLQLQVESGVVSLGGYFQEQLGRVLRVGDELRLQGWRIRVLSMRGMAPALFLLKPARNGR